MAHQDNSPVVRSSVWIVPAGDALARIEKLTRQAHARAGGPRFKPHLTLLSGSETTQANAELRAKHLAAKLAPFEITLHRIEWRREYHRCLYVAAELTPALIAARRAAYEIFEMNPPPPFDPHVSLVYGDVDEALKRELAAGAGGRLDLKFKADAVQLVNASPSVAVTGWKTLAEFKFAA